jgi:hypothetical protein
MITVCIVQLLDSFGPGDPQTLSRPIASASPQMLIHQSYIMRRARTMRSLQQFQTWLAKCDNRLT